MEHKALAKYIANIVWHVLSRSELSYRHHQVKGDSVLYYLNLVESTYET